MNNIWFISDTHFNHSNILTFKDNDGNLIRPDFKDVDHMNQTMVDNWNQLVKPQDKIYHLGDVSFGNAKRMTDILARLNGKKRLIMGNHDTYDIQSYAAHFQKIGSWRQFKDMPIPFICSHYPLHDDALYGRNTVFNVHGHIHQRVVTKKDTNVPDKRYINICVEKTNYSPVHIDDLLKKMKDA
jgi:calcineurin-like phosphoesterase family protein